jgi:hypothetical protein
MAFITSPFKRTLELRPATLRPPSKNEGTKRDSGTDPAGRKPARSGFYVAVDEFAGLDRLDRVELDDEPTE